MIFVKEIEDYIAYYRNNKDKFNEERIKLIENVVIPFLDRNDVTFDEKRYYECISFAERWYYKLFPYQKFIYAFVFMYEKNGMPSFRTFFIMMGRGNGKDGLLIPLMNYFLTSNYGVKNYHIEIVANNEDQAEKMFMRCYDILESNKKIFKSHFKWNKEHIKSKKTGAEMSFNTSNAKTKDGKEIGAIIFNEVHAYENYDGIKVFESALGKINSPRIFIISTNGYVREGPLDDYLSVCNAILNGEPNVLRYFPFICKLDKKEEMYNKENWEKACPSLPFMPTLEQEMIIAFEEAKRFIAKKVEFLVKRMNIAQDNDDNVVTSWENILAASYSDTKNKIPRVTPELQNRDCVIGIDFADINDFASAGFLFWVNGEFVWRQRTWICKKSKFFSNIKFPFENAGENGFTDYVIVDKESIDIEDMLEWIFTEINLNNYNVLKIAMDTYRFKLFKNVFAKYGIYPEDRQGNGLLKMIRSPLSISAIYAPFIETQFLNKTINIGDSAIMRWFIRNTKMIIDKKNGNKSYEKVEPKYRKNDGFSAMLVAFSSKELIEVEEQVIYV